MKISIIGKGAVGTALKSGLERNGHEIVAVGREPEGVRLAGNSAELIILAVPFAEIDSAVSLLSSSVDGKIVVDATNVLTPDYNLALGFDKSGAEILQEKIPTAKVVKAFNTAFANTMEFGSIKGEKLSGFVAGNDHEAVETVLDLVGSLGFEAINAGPLEAARLLEPLAVLTIKLGFFQGFGPDIGFRFVH